MRIGFTGTQQGMTKAQKTEFRRTMEIMGVTEFHHGDCVGADAEAHGIVRGLPGKVRVVSHPSNIRGKRAFCKAEEYWPERRPPDRNTDIVLSTRLLVAAPKGFAEELRSGTWSTVRRARKYGRRLLIIWPDGTTTNDEEKEGVTP